MIGVGVSALALAVVSYIGVECAVESVRWRCHPDEKSVATRIRDLGGGYRATGHERWHIASVWLNDTQATDADIEAVLTLSQLQFLDLRCTQASNAVLHEICAHNRLRDVRVYGTLIETQAIERLWELWNGRLYIDTESHGGSCKDRRSRNEPEQKGPKGKDGKGQGASAKAGGRSRMKESYKVRPSRPWPKSFFVSLMA